MTFQNQRLVKKAVRELEREISNMQSSVRKLEGDIKKMAKQGQMVCLMSIGIICKKNDYIIRLLFSDHCSNYG